MQERAVELENQLNISKNEKLAANKAWQEEKNSLFQANVKLAEENQSLQAQLKANANSLSVIQIQVAEDQNKLAETQANLSNANAKLNESQAELKRKSKDLEAAKSDAFNTTNELKGQLEESKNILRDSNSKFAQQAQELNNIKQLLTLANDKLQQSTQSLEYEIAGLVQQLNELKAQYEVSKAERASAIKSLKESYEYKIKLLEEGLVAEKINTQADCDAKLKFLETESEKTAHSLIVDRDNHAKRAIQLEAIYQNISKENELLLLQLMQAQEELFEHYEQRGEFEKLYQAYKARWDRLEKRLPNYLDYGVIDIVDVDNLSEVPTITWRVKDFAQARVALSEFSFATCFQNGHPGIGLLKDSRPQLFVPKLLKTNKDQLNLFVSMGTTEYRQIEAAISILNQLEAGQWQGFEFPAQFDLAFWRPSLKALISQVMVLPAMLRYDSVKLKRELINPDYEHLWLEFNGLNLSNMNWNKFEIRIGAALVQSDGFSQYPKFEIPLIDGKTKPFDTWYAESHDDTGPKLELRFALDKNVFDVAVLSNLSELDKALVLRLIYAMPEALNRLESNATAIHRPWKTWFEFAAGAVKVLEASKALANKATSEPGALPAQNRSQAALPPPIENKTKLVLQDSAPVKLAATLVAENKSTKTGKVINILNKAPAKTTPKVPRKTRT